MLKVILCIQQHSTFDDMDCILRSGCVGSESRVLGDNSTQLLLMTKIQTGSIKVVYYHLTSA